MRREGGFGGMVISDAGAVDGGWGCDKTKPVLHDRACHNYTHDAVDATSAAFAAGCDLNYGSASASHLATAVAGGDAMDRGADANFGDDDDDDDDDAR